MAALLTAKRKKSKQQPSSWDQIKNLLSCKQIDGSKIHDPSKNHPPRHRHRHRPIYSSICTTFSSRVVHRADDISPESSSSVAALQETCLLTKKSRHGSSSSSSSSSSRMHLRKLSGCYECRQSFVDPAASRRYPLTTECAVCSQCGEVFPKIESLELHQALKHAVSELGPEDSSRNIVEIIFKSSWLKKDSPICKIERILKVHNTQRTIQRFEDYRDAVKTRAKRHARCAADGNELLRFHCATLACPLGARGSSALCGGACGVCNVIRHGFQGNKAAGIFTTATSGRAHDCLGAGSGSGSGSRRAMLVCRVIAGRVKRTAEDDDGGGGESPAGGSYDSVAGSAGIYSNLEELCVFSSRAILPCFVVIYKAVEGGVI
ncbi:uncharacterized protein LOC127246251 [Andrographis paniculata]|uniref:uncharacterized protein LOC127246251 n=1 Tax=Andrographis paniculata TaxID=175694 RepID=UPI0021E6F52F|nr:uncharacterized protein LOC127246251 [Andrographis paniculata]